MSSKRTRKSNKKISKSHGMRSHKTDTEQSARPDDDQAPDTQVPDAELAAQAASKADDTPPKVKKSGKKRKAAERSASTPCESVAVAGGDGPAEPISTGDASDSTKSGAAKARRRKRSKQEADDDGDCPSSKEASSSSGGTSRLQLFLGRSFVFGSSPPRSSSSKSGGRGIEGLKSRNLTFTFG